MGFDPELEEILNSIKNKEGTLENKTKPIDLPKAKEEGDFSLSELKKYETTYAEKEPEEPKKPEKQKKKAPMKKEEPKKEIAPKEKAQNKKAEKPKEEKKHERAEEKTKADFKALAKGKPFKIACAVILIAAAVLAVFIINKSMYLKKYEQKYGIAFPKGIPEEFCDSYGENQTLAGSIIIDDNDSKTLIYSSPKSGEALFEKGSSLEKDQHYRAAALSVENADLEALYKTPESYVSSSQSFTFKTIYGEKQRYHVIAAYIVNTKPEDDNGYSFPYNAYGNFTKDSYSHYQDTIKRRSLYNTGYKIKETDYCMTLSVPTDIMPDFRFVIVGVKVDKVVKTMQTKENKMIRYPQAYCDKLGIHNIFHLTSKWYPEIIINPETGDTKQLTAEDFK